MIRYALSFSVNKENMVFVVICLTLGIVFASLYTLFIKKMRGEFVIALIDAGAFNEETSKSTEELGIKMYFLRRLCIKKTFTFSPDYYEVNGKTTRYYVKEEHIDRLTSKYGNSGITVFQIILTFIALFAVTLIMITAVPEILNMLDF